ncbi:MAG: ClbS/DfsB family four-helix bundle protein [Sulfitobacter litoralis]|nr:ClbS/DfsB family four-helix bundle protein [Sulfitobacter litoralis]
MAIPASKTELLDAISQTFDKLIIDLSKVPEGRARECSLEGHVKGTTMSPADLVSYLIGWNELVLKWLGQDDKGQDVDFPETGFKWNELGQLAQKFYNDCDDLGYRELLDRLKKAKDNLVETISARSDKELYGGPWHGKWTKGRMIQFNTSSPYANARSRIRRWLKAQT